MKLKRRTDKKNFLVIWIKDKMTMWKTRQGFCTMKLYNNLKRDVAQLGSAFVLGTKCHGFKSCHPYLLLLLWVVTGD